MSDQELTLDPDDWDAFSELAHRMLEDTLGQLRTLRDRPAWQPAPENIRRAILDEPVPLEPQGEENVYQAYRELVEPYPTGNRDPRFYGWVQGNGTPYGMMSDLLAAGLNPHMAGFNQTPTQVEQKTIEWLRELMGFPEGASGIFLSGGSMANITGLTVARNAKAGYDIREEGLQVPGKPKLLVYGSTETHSWAKKALELLGLGNSAFRRIGVLEDFSIDIEQLGHQIVLDKMAGYQPIAILATAGTVNTGASDDLHAIADLCIQHDLWMHVDGAFGALAYLSPKLRPIVDGLERADSVAFDLHKWMYLPFECACLLVRDGEAHHATFSQKASYIAGLSRGTIAGGLVLADLGLELTRSFKALKAWMSLKAYGVDKFVKLIEQNVDQAQYLVEKVKAEPELEVTAPTPLNIVCFRYVGSGIPADQLNALNTELLLRIQERGIAVPSSTVLAGNFCLRVCIVNHRTQRQDLDDLVAASVAIGRELAIQNP